MTASRSQRRGDTWRRVTPGEAGFAADLERKLAAGIESGLLRHIHEVLVARGDRLVLEHYGKGLDENWGSSIGTVTFGPETLHDLRSVTKSIVGLLYGIALDRGLVPPPDAPLAGQFPEYADLVSGGALDGLTIEHALTMTLGLAWDENRPYTDPANSEIAMENAADRNRYVLSRPKVAEPGARWIYSGGCVALVGAIIARGTGMSLPDFARQALFEPLGIDRFEWTAGHDGVASAASGLRLTGPGLLRIGRMILANGSYDGTQIVSRSWLDGSRIPAAATGDGLSYGRLWFLGEAQVGGRGALRPWMGAFGNGGQRLWVMPEADLAVVIFSGHYNAPDSWVTPMRIWREIVVANLERPDA
jgi:CubicO group peptidase (beta-lactamase class C family)